MAGYPLINANVAPNTSVSIANLGRLYLHRVILTANSIEVRMIELVVGTNNRGLPVGLVVTVAVSGVSAI